MCHCNLDTWAVYIYMAWWIELLSPQHLLFSNGCRQANIAWRPITCTTHHMLLILTTYTRNSTFRLRVDVQWVCVCVQFQPIDVRIFAMEWFWFNFIFMDPIIILLQLIFHDYYYTWKTYLNCINVIVNRIAKLY